MDGRRGLVLLAEDNDDYREILATSLRHLGFEVSPFHDGARLLEAVFSTPPPFVVLTDLYMSGVSGFDVLAELRAASLLGLVPVAVLSAAVRDAFPAAEEGVVALEKPVDLGRLVATLEALAASARDQASAASVRLAIERRRRAPR